MNATNKILNPCYYYVRGGSFVFKDDLKGARESNPLHPLAISSLMTTSLPRASIHNPWHHQDSQVSLKA